MQLVLQHCCKTSWIAILRVIPPMFKPVNNLIYCKTGFMCVVRRATSLFNLFCSNVAKQVARFLLPVFPSTLIRFLSHTELWALLYIIIIKIFLYVQKIFAFCPENHSLLSRTALAWLLATFPNQGSYRSSKTWKVIKYKNFIFQAWKVMQNEVMFSRLVIAAVEATTMRDKDEWLNSVNGVHFGEHKTLSVELS